MKDLYEAVEIHDTLNPKLWDKNMNLIPDVKGKIMEIVEEFKENVKDMTDIELNPVDIHLLGSNASYNYTSKSDLDVHLVVNFEMIDTNENLVQALMNLQKSEFNSEYDISIHGIDVELYVEDIRANTISNGIYSVVTDQWIKKPEPITDIPEIDIEDKIDEWKKKINEVLDSDDIKKVSDTIDELYLIRKNGLATDGEYGEGNQLFKEIRNLDLLQDLKDKYMKLRSKELSLEKYKRESMDYSDDIKSNIVVYESDDVVITQPKWSDDVVYVYQVSDYNTPFRGNSKTGWLSAGTWKLKNDNLWHLDRTYKYSSYGAKDFEEIAEITRNDTKIESKRRNSTMISLCEDMNNIWFNSIENEEESIPDAIAYGVSDKKIDYMISMHDMIEKLLKARRSEIVFTRLDSITEEVDPNFLSHFKTIKSVQKYAMSLREDDNGDRIVCVPRYGAFDIYFTDEDTAWNILEHYQIDWSTYEEPDYTPSSTYGDYGPSNPWDAPGMSKSDFI